jgi:1,4-dihydroxy-2-naphthoate octaprenyltransferase
MEGITGTFTRREDTSTALDWVKLARLQFYPGPLLAYTMGAVSLWGATGRYNLPAFLLGYLCVFLLELAAVLTNEYFDYIGDCLNIRGGIFNGGSRMLAEGHIAPEKVKRLIPAVILALIPAGFLLWMAAGGTSGWSILAVLSAGALLGVGYTAPPAKFAYRGFGELTVGVTHSFLIVFCGHLFQGGQWSDPRPWVLSVPVFFSIFAAITLAGVPDRDADMSVSKRTLAAEKGVRGAGILALISVAASVISAIVLLYTGFYPGAAGGLILLAGMHGIVLAAVTARIAGRKEIGNQDAVIALSLSFVSWFAVIPILGVVLQL